MCISLSHLKAKIEQWLQDLEYFCDFVYFHAVSLLFIFLLLSLKEVARDCDLFLNASVVVCMMYVCSNCKEAENRVYKKGHVELFHQCHDHISEVLVTGT